MDPVNVRIELQNIRCYDEGDGPGSAEPYLWVVFFKIDGDTASVNTQLALQGTATVVGTPGNHGNLGTRDVSEGDIVLIPPQIGEFQTILREIPLQSPILGVTGVPGQIGCVVILMEEDNTPNDAVAAGHNELNQAVRDALNELIPTLNILNQQVTPATMAQLEARIAQRVEQATADNVSIWDFVTGLGDMDDRVGSRVFLFSQNQLLQAGGVELLISQRFENEGRWDIFGRIVGTPIITENQPGRLEKPQIPSVVAYWHHRANRIYAFVRSQNGELWIHNWTGVNWIWTNQGRPTNATVATSPSAVKSIQVAWGTQWPMLHAFVGGNNGHLYVHYWDGRSWQWIDLGTPPGATVASAPTALADERPLTGELAEAFERLYGFVRGSNGHLYVNHWDGHSWQWADRGTPPGTTIVGEVAVTVFHLYRKRIYTFMRGQDNHLWINYGYLNEWQWTDQGAPPSAGVATPPDVVNFFHDNADRIYAFIGGTDGHLWCHYWDGNQWNWSDQGSPSNALVASAPCAVTFQHDRTNRIYVFVRGSDGHLWIHYWDGGRWVWADQGMPGRIAVDTGTDVLKYHYEGVDRMYAFVIGSNSHLYIHYWDGNQWRWTHQGTP